MGFFYKFLCYFVISYLILVIPIGKKNIFSHLNEVTDPITRSIAASTKKIINHNIQKGKNFGKQLFNNATPIFRSDSISTSQSGIKKGFDWDKETEDEKTQEHVITTIGETPSEQYTQEELELINNLTKK